MTLIRKGKKNVLKMTLTSRDPVELKIYLDSMSSKESKGFNYFMKLLTFSQYNSHYLGIWPPSVLRVTFHILTTLYQCWTNFGHIWNIWAS